MATTGRDDFWATNFVMAGRVPAIHVLLATTKKDVDARDKPGHDGEDIYAESVR
jgi:hypothetical protein